MSSPPISAAPRRTRHRAARIAMMTAGWLLILLSPLVGLLPGPGGVFVFAGGLSLVLKTSRAAQRGYVRLKRRWPRLGGWCDWGLRRASPRRRAARAGMAQGASD